MQSVLPYFCCINFNTVQRTCTAGDLDGDEVLQVYHRASRLLRETLTHPVPLRSLIEFERVFVPAHTSSVIKVEFLIPLFKLGLTDITGSKVLYAGSHEILITNGVKSDIVFTVYIDEETSLST